MTCFLVSLDIASISETPEAIWSGGGHVAADSLADNDACFPVLCFSGNPVDIPSGAGLGGLLGQAEL